MSKTNSPKDKEIRSRTEEQQVRDAVANARSYASTLDQLGLIASGANYKWLKHKIRLYSLNIEHMKGQAWSRGVKNKSHNGRERPLEEVLIENSDYRCTNSLKIKLLKYKLLKYECNECGISEWRNKKLSLHLDHINGVNDDNRIENLRLLCPNCHAQTQTYAGNNRGTGAPRARRAEKQCMDCGVTVGHSSSRCTPCAVQYRSKAVYDVSCHNCSKHIGWRDKEKVACRPCAALLRKTKIQWPSLVELQEIVNKNSYLAVGRDLGVSDNAVRKHIRSHLELEKRRALYDHHSSGEA